MRALFLVLTLASTVALAQADPDPWFAPDKALHFGVSAGIAALGYGGAALLTEQRGVRVALGAGLGLAAGIGKELLDLAGLGSPSWRDLAWDVLGTGFGVLASWLLDVFVITPLSHPAPRPAGASP
jgi:putative lipoprotein